jgi:ribose/xylose/arabinose/galactoside ABC-type transport system permease subunit
MARLRVPLPASDPAPVQKAPSRLSALFSRNKDSSIDILILFLLVQFLCILAALLFPDRFHYLNPSNVSVMLKAIPILGVLALGVGMLMISGEFDLSVGATYTFTGIVMATLVETGWSAYLAAPAALLVGVLIGLLNGFITLRFAIPSFIATLGTMLFWQGMTLFYHGATSIRFYPTASFSSLMAGSFGFLEAAFIWYLLFTIMFWALLHHHKLGNHFFAVGGNKLAATAIGIKPKSVKMIAFAIAGFTAALAGILAAARVGSIQPGQGAGLELQAIAACVIGGLALSGGRGSVLGIFLGAALIYTIQDILLLVRAPGFYLDIFVGILIVGAAIFNEYIRQRRK